MKKKPWTILLYLNGNNELAMEMEKTFLVVKEIKTHGNVNVAVEMGKAPCKLVNLIRHNEEVYKEPWTGVRRYGIEDGKIIFRQQLSNVNMADYMNLYRFIEWGINEFPAHRYMLCISGHGFMVEALTDLTGDMPYTMGVYEMCLAINNVKKQLNKHIDILDLDICNMNSLEILYELGKSQDNTVKHVLTYIHDGPLEGMDYGSIIEKLDRKSTEEILKSIVKDSKSRLVSVIENHGKLERMKQLCSEISYYKLNKTHGKNDIHHAEVMEEYTREMNIMAQKLIVCHNNYEKNDMLLDIMCFDRTNIRNVREFSRLYFKLSFSRNSYCSNMITESTGETIENTNLPIPCQEMLTRDNILLFIKTFNPNMCDSQIHSIEKQIYK